METGVCSKREQRVPSTLSLEYYTQIMVNQQYLEEEEEEEEEGGGGGGDGGNGGMPRHSCVSRRKLQELRGGVSTEMGLVEKVELAPVGMP
ncbi:hypothetical protein M0804_003212 [Polistes exclamans]|nr:hypothetical protein M0804_003212 [Polistes exclamans]